MLHLALAALLAGTPITGGPGGDKEKADAQDPDPIESIIVADRSADAGEEDPINDTYALGRTDRIPVKLWLGYSRATDDEAYDTDGDEVALSAVTPPLGITEARAQRAFVGAQINVINFTNFSIGAGGQLVAAQNEVETALGQLDSGFTLQTAKVYGIIRGRTLGVHGGMMFDLGPDEDLETVLIPDGDYTNSDQVNAWFVGADFDYPAENFRLFGGIDYFNRDELAAAQTDGAIEDDELIVFNAGAGVRISWVEIGAAALLRTNLAINRFNMPTGGHQGSVAPYLILSPPSLPVAISVKGAVLSEYADYGFSLGGAGDLKTTSGFTVTASLGF